MTTLRSSPGAMAGRCPQRPGPAVRRRRAGCDPRPARWPGAAAGSRTRSVTCPVLRSSPGAMAGRCMCWVSAAGAAPGLRSSPGAMAGRCGGVLAPRTPTQTALRSSPGAMAGRCAGDDEQPGGVGGVAILARRDGRALQLRPVDARSQRQVAILARRDGRALLLRRRRQRRPVRVAILARRDGRAPHTGPPGEASEAVGLRSSPGAMAGRCGTGGAGGVHHATLRSSPGAMAGRCLWLRFMEGSFASLRSSPGAMAGRCLTRRCLEVDPRKLRSSPGAVAGRCSCCPCRHRGGARCCDPRPARWPGAAASPAPTSRPIPALRSSPGAMAGRCHGAHGR